VKQSGGGIHVESEPGKGSVFVIYFPREIAAVESAEPLLPTMAAAHNAETVLVVEDEAVVRQLVCAVLSDVGYNVVCAASPLEALTLVKGHPAPIDLLVTDVVMPEMHGPALAREIVALRPTVRVLYISGYSENDISDQGVIDPGLDVLQKPFTMLDGGSGGSLG
jgi:CheY-like chemotaxis protein